MSEGGVEGVRERNERGGACSRCPVGTFLTNRFVGDDAH